NWFDGLNPLSVEGSSGEFPSGRLKFPVPRYRAAWMVSLAEPLVPPAPPLAHFPVGKASVGGDL
ncbi:MAG TPA: hypothetical protein PLU40_07805, partial [Methanoculleus sp.]|nr:hypothetical protein [Methanoculleus sp.]